MSFDLYDNVDYFDWTIEAGGWIFHLGYMRTLHFGKILDLEFMISGYTRVGLYASIYGTCIQCTHYDPGRVSAVDGDGA